MPSSKFQFFSKVNTHICIKADVWESKNKKKERELISRTISIGISNQHHRLFYALPSSHFRAGDQISTALNRNQRSNKKKRSHPSSIPFFLDSNKNFNPFPFVNNKKEEEEVLPPSTVVVLYHTHTKRDNEDGRDVEGELCQTAKRI